MPKAQSSPQFNGEADNFYDPTFTIDMNQRMHVPKRIRVNGDFTDENISSNGPSWNQMIPPEKFEMHVPDKIIVIGEGQQIGVKAPPREIAFENSVIPPEQGIIRVQTPPRVLKLDDHYFPPADEEESNSYMSEMKEPMPVRQHGQYNVETQIVRHTREPTPSYSALDVSLPPSEEIQHLRRQVGKLNRRVMAIELEMLQRQQRDKFLYAITVAYFLLKAFSWLTRN